MYYWPKCSLVKWYPSVAGGEQRNRWTGTFHVVHSSVINFRLIPAPVCHYVQFIRLTRYMTGCQVHNLTSWRLIGTQKCCLAKWADWVSVVPQRHPWWAKLLRCRVTRWVMCYLWEPQQPFSSWKPLKHGKLYSVFEAFLKLWKHSEASLTPPLYWAFKPLLPHCFGFEACAHFGFFFPLFPSFRSHWVLFF